MILRHEYGNIWMSGRQRTIESGKPAAVMTGKCGKIGVSDVPVRKAGGKPCRHFCIGDGDGSVRPELVVFPRNHLLQQFQRLTGRRRIAQNRDRGLLQAVCRSWTSYSRR